MILAHKLLAKGTLLKVPGCHWGAISLKQIFLHTCVRSPLRVYTKTCILSSLRYRASNAVGTKISKVTVRSGTKTEKKTRVLKKLVLLAAPHKWRLFGAIAFLLVSSTVTMAAPFCFGKVIDIINSAEKDKVKENLTKVSLLLLAVYVLGALCNFCRIYLITTTGYRITQTLRRQAYGAILRQEVAFFDRHSTGELAGRIAGDTEQISSAVTNNVSDGLRSSISAIAGISMMVYLSPKFALISLSGLPVISALMFGIGMQFKKISTEIQNQMAELNKRAQEKISNIRTVKAFGKEQWEEQRYEADLQELLKICYKECTRKGVFFGLAGLSGSSVILSVLYYGGLMVSQSTLTIGELSAFLAYAAYVALSFRGLATFSSDLNKALGANERLVALIERQPLIPCMGGLTLDKPLLGDIEFQNVNFAYPSRDSINVLQDFNLKIPKRTVTAIVGHSGSGKSTLAALLLRFYEPSTGCVLLDNHDLKTLDPLWVKSQIAVVPQEPTLFSGTIKDNILYGAENASEDDVKRVAERSYVSQFAICMPQGLDTYVGERGVTLSGGQRQRVAIARALIKEPRILILDEATSALDAESENYVQKALEEATVGRTVLVIAHRLSTIKNANKIVLLDRGRITETGTYNELMSIVNGSFRKLVQHQTSAGQLKS